MAVPAGSAGANALSCIGLGSEGNGPAKVDAALQFADICLAAIEQRVPVMKEAASTDEHVLLDNLRTRMRAVEAALARGLKGCGFQESGFTPATRSVAVIDDAGHARQSKAKQPARRPGERQLVRLVAAPHDGALLGDAADADAADDDRATMATAAVRDVHLQDMRTIVVPHSFAVKVAPYMLRNDGNFRLWWDFVGVFFVLYSSIVASDMCCFFACLPSG